MEGLPKVLILGAGGYAQALGEALACQSQATILVNRRNGAYGPSKAENVTVIEQADVSSLLRENDFDLLLPSTINWQRESWGQNYDWNVGEGSIGIFSPHGQGMRLERERAFGMEKATEHSISCSEGSMQSPRLPTTVTM